MPIVYLTPDDLNPTQTLAVLEFLNSVSSAEEIADRVEIPGELDVGPRVGQRILDHRAQLEGGFTSLTQLMDVHLVGPERFTEIVASVLGIPLPGFSVESLDDMIRRAVGAQLQGVSTSVAPEQYRINVQRPLPVPWFGQEITLNMKVTSVATGKPAVNLPVTLESGDMWLSTQFGYEAREGKVISTRTATDGSFRLRMRTMFDERLTVDQFSALNEALRTLDSEMPAPRDMRDKFEQLIDLYEDVRNKNLRAAMDIVYHTSGRHLTENLNQQDQLYQWSFHSSLLRIYLDADAQPATPDVVISNATASQVGIFNMSWKQWLMPWYQIYLERLNNSNLQEGFQNAKNRFQTDAGITADILGQAHGFVTSQNGLLGAALSKKVIDKEIHCFLAKEMSSLPVQTRRSMYPSLMLAGGSVSSASTGTLALVNQTKADVEVVIDKRINESGQNSGVLLESINTLAGRVDQINNEVVEQKQKYSDIEIQFGDLNEGVVSGLGKLQGDITGINLKIKEIDERTLTIDTNLVDLSSSYRQLEMDFGTIDNSIKTINTDLDKFDARTTNLQNSVSELNNNAVMAADIKRDQYGNFIDIERRTIIR